MSVSQLPRSAATGVNRDELFTVLADLPHDCDQARECRAAIVESYLPMAARLAHRYRNRGPSIDDLIQVASLALVGAVERYQLDRGVDFTPYAITTVLGELKRHFRDTTWAIRVPRALQEQHLAIAAAATAFGQQNGRTPTPSDLSTVTGLPVTDVKAALHAGAAYRALSLDASPSTSGHVPEEYLREDASGVSPEDWIPVAAAVRRMPARDRRIIYLRFFEDLSQSDIARHVGVSQMQVSRILTRAIQALQQELAA